MVLAVCGLSAKGAQFTADLAVSFCFLNSLLSLKLYLHPLRSCFWPHLVFPFVVKERDVFGPAREEFCEWRFPPAAGLMNHSMAMALLPQNHVCCDIPSSHGGRAPVTTFLWAHKGAHLSVLP